MFFDSPIVGAPAGTAHHGFPALERGAAHRFAGAAQLVALNLAILIQRKLS